ncbi:hypothetical protein P7D22_08210 [Lichenihabitans sp. Uapishka_5]|uniref:hypothetical protein n=1 Tax=Lichenihabitans sp. Uapishka_5 TaxID=3037302 RepID=UPI0029E81E4B|nr:hypothetical protein [Lichenihabitans sp. Uapishka_5]MDX7951163.1 hypothetical protein [Lichenihabitans sp. Uapishka_5]
MDHLSFASAYRTAAILAAFSQASRGADDPCRGLRSFGLPTGSSAPTAAGRGLRRLAVWLGAAMGLEPNRACRKRPIGSTKASGAADPAAPSRLVSHFAFCDGAPEWHDRHLG